MTKPRDYKKEYADYHGKPEQKLERAHRNTARAEMTKAGRVRKGDGKEVDHQNSNPMDNNKKNLKVMSRHANRVKGN